jgi:hypothetical protein
LKVKQIKRKICNLFSRHIEIKKEREGVWKNKTSMRLKKLEIHKVIIEEQRANELPHLVGVTK